MAKLRKYSSRGGKIARQERARKRDQRRERQALRELKRVSL